MRMKGYIFLLMNLAVAAATGPLIVEIGEDKAIPDINRGSGFGHDDIMELANTERSAVTAEEFLWTSPVPYVLEDSLQIFAKGVIMRAFDQFRLKSCIDFKPRDSEDFYISVQRLNGCFSYVGKLISNGQVLSIGDYCAHISIVEHEFLHALGFYHEHSRYDRDEHVTIVLDNVIEGFETNFRKVSSADSTTSGVPYDYWSVMHYGQNAFSNGNGTTINTKDPSLQNVIGQRREMSPSDVLELNRRYKCESSIAFQMYCGFTNGTMCQMNRCSRSGNDWEMVTDVSGGPSSDHTSLPGGSGDHGKDAGYFMHASTASGEEGDSALLVTQMMSPKRDCHVQCLQFYYYHSGNESDELNIWIREFKDEQDSTGTLHLMGQLTGSRTSHWKLHHVSLNATNPFQVEFEVRKGRGSSTGGFSIDDINLSELECPHVTLQIDDFVKRLMTSPFRTFIYGPRQYSRGGYAYRVATILDMSFYGLYVQLVSGDYDDQLEWPCPRRQVTFQMLDQNPNIQLQMSKQTSIITSTTQAGPNGILYWDNPRKIGTKIVDENNEEFYAGPLLGRNYFGTLEDLQYREYQKGGSIVFAFNFQDLTPLVNGSVLPCPQVRPVHIAHPPTNRDENPCSPGILSTTAATTTTTPYPPTTTTTPYPPTTTTPYPPTTTTTPYPPTTTTTPYLPTTTTPYLPFTTTTTTLPPQTTDDSIFGFSPRTVASPLLALLLALMLLIH